MITTFKHAIRLLENDMRNEETRTIHSYQNKEKALERRKIRLEEMQRELAALKKLVDEEVKTMNKCTFCGREDNQDTKVVGGYTILEICTDCEEEILDEE